MMRDRLGSFAVLLVTLPLVAASSAAEPSAAPTAVTSITSATLITGTSAMFSPGTGVANLDAGDLVAGNTKWDPIGSGVVFNDTRVGFLWDPQGGSTVFAEPFGVYLTPNIVFPRAISPGRTVVGGDILRQQLRVLPFLWTPADGFNYLPTPCTSNQDRPGDVPSGSCSGGAAAVSADGTTPVGTVFNSRTDPAMAARWGVKATKKGPRATLDLLPTRDAWSDANDVSADGSVIVGDSGSSSATLAATRWVNGSQSPLDPVGDSSSALFTSADGTLAIGTASVGGRTVLVRWAADGSATSFDPPEGTSIVEIKAINPSGTAAVGALAAADNWAPFLWNETGGFTIIPELDEPAYDRSEALDVSDDGTSVVGALQASVVSNGFPRAFGFLWSGRTGLVLITDLMVAFGQADADYFSATAISGDGLRVLAVGNAPGTEHDTHSVIVTLSPY